MFQMPKKLTFLRLFWIAKLCVALVSVSALLRLLGYRRTQRLLATNGVAQCELLESEKKQKVEDIIYALSAIENRIVEFNCLSRAMVGSFFLGRSGIASQIRFGIRKQQENFGSHAWLELDDCIVLGGKSSSLAYLPIEFPKNSHE
jgi:Transglutaminase-like superfamily